MSLIDSLEEYVLTVHGKLGDNKSLMDVHDVHLGDQDRLPKTPCLSVEPGNKSREYNGAPRRFAVQLDAYVMVYVEKIQNVSENVQLLLHTMELVEAVLHSDSTLGGRVISSFVADSEPGYTTRGGTLMRAGRLTFRALSQKQLPYPPPQ